MEGYDYIIENYSPAGPEVVKLDKLESARRLSAYLIQGIQNIYDGHIRDKEDIGYKTFKEWFSDTTYVNTNLRDEEIAVKRLLIAFDKNFDLYCNTPYFKNFMTDRTVDYKYYNVSKSKIVFDVATFVKDMMIGDQIKPVEELRKNKRLNTSLKDSIDYIVSVANHQMPQADITLK